nr:RNA-dependent RNA polymerase [Sarcosphaera coronaria partitivirus]
MCLHKPNLRYLYTIGKYEMKQAFTHNYQRSSQREQEVRFSALQYAILKHGSYDLLQKVLLGKRRSDSSDERLIQDFHEFNQPAHPVPRDKHYLRALKVTEQIFRPKRTLHPISFPDLRYYPWTKNVSAEAPYNFEQKWKKELIRMQSLGENDDNKATFSNLEDQIFIENRKLIHLIKEKDSRFWTPEGKPKPYYFTTLHARAHVVGHEDADKIRAVFGVPKLLLMAENQFIWPLQASYLNQDTSQHPMLWGNEISKGGWKNLERIIHSKGRVINTCLSLDWSEFDKRAQHEVIDDVHNIWRSWFDFEQYEPTIYYPHAKVSRSSERLDNLWQWMTDMVKHYPILQPDGKVYQWERNGIASGFQQTQLLDSFVNTIMLLTTLSKLGINIEGKHFFLKVQGDDSLITFPERMFQIHGKDFLRLIAKEAHYYFNAKLSEKKSHIAKDTFHNMYVLGYYNYHGIPYREEDDLLSHLVFPEHEQRLAQTASACIGIAQAAMGCSKPIYNICEDVFNFIVNKLNIEPERRALNWMEKYLFSEIPDLTSFPTFDETRLAAYDRPARTSSQKEKLWPTTFEAKQGFYFINNIC